MSNREILLFCLFIVHGLFYGMILGFFGALINDLGVEIALVGAFVGAFYAVAWVVPIYVLCRPPLEFLHPDMDVTIVVTLGLLLLFPIPPNPVFLCCGTTFVFLLVVTPLAFRRFFSERKESSALNLRPSIFILLLLLGLPLILALLLSTSAVSMVRGVTIWWYFMLVYTLYVFLPYIIWTRLRYAGYEALGFREAFFLIDRFGLSIVRMKLPHSQDLPGEGTVEALADALSSSIPKPSKSGS